MAYRHDNSIADMVEEGRHLANAKAAREVADQRRAREAVAPLISYLGTRGLKAELAVDRRWAALMVEVSVPRWPLGERKQWRFFRIADKIAGVTPEAVEALARQPGFAEVLDGYARWAVEARNSEALKRRIFVPVAAIVTVIGVALLGQGFDLMGGVFLTSLVLSAAYILAGLIAGALD